MVRVLEFQVGVLGERFWSISSFGTEFWVSFFWGLSFGAEFWVRVGLEFWVSSFPVRVLGFLGQRVLGQSFGLEFLESESFGSEFRG